jgi:branched-chain amino acid transport system substrate-binding protein
MKVSKKKELKLLYVICGVVACLVIFTSQLNAQEKTIKIGVIAPLSGPYYWLGRQNVMGIELAVEEINQEGGLLGRKLEMFTEDDETNPSVGVRKARKLLQENNVDFLAGPVSSSVSLAILETAERFNKIFFITCSGANEITGSKCRKVGFRYNYYAALEINTMAKILEKFEEKKIFAIASDYAAGRSAMGYAKDKLTKLGKEWVGEIYVPLGTNDFAAPLTRAKESNPDIFLNLTAENVDSLYIQAEGFGLTKKMKMVNGWSVDIRDIKSAGKAMIGSYGPLRYFFDVEYSPLARQFLTRFVSKFKEEPNYAAADSYGGIKMLAEGIKKAQTVETDRLISTLEGLSVDTLWGYKFTIRPCDHQVIRPGFACQVIESKKYPHPTVKIIGVFPGEVVVPRGEETGCERCK